MPLRGCSAALREGETRYTSGTTPTDRRYTGQIEESELGLYFYNARWYDPYITQFSQPDTIVPDPYNPLNWNRYSYVRYNPINSTDPTGHRACDDKQNSQCIAWTASYVLSAFGITTQGLSLSQKWNVIDSAISTGEKLAGANGDPVKAFKSAVGDIFIDVGEGKGPKDENGKSLGNCLTDSGTISCEHAMDVGNTVHEFFHAFDKRYKAIANDGDHLASDYLPMEYRDKPYTDKAFLCSDIRCLAHPPSLSGFDSMEQFANIGQNWVLEGTNVNMAGFSDTTEGNNLRIWMDSYMQNFLSKMGVSEQ